MSEEQTAMETDKHPWGNYEPDDPEGFARYWKAAQEYVDLNGPDSLTCPIGLQLAHEAFSGAISMNDATALGLAP
jgi:hypothetical protein